jgi:Spy/CpxP family protein refolding chaperone
MRTILTTLAMALLTLPAVAQHMPYSGQESRDIKALSPEEIADLLAGRGMGMAKAAELNHYPGPAHILELKDKLALSPDQAAVVQTAFDRMATAAKPLGAELVQRERALDDAFKQNRMTSTDVATETEAIGDLQGRLRAVHLAAHLQMRAVLTPEQIAMYDELRGYAGGAPAMHGGMHHH